MRSILTLLILFLSTSLYAETSALLSRMIEKYPMAERRVWYYFDHTNSTQYYRTEFSSPRNSIKSVDLIKLTDNYLNAFNLTDFKKSTGALYRSPDSTSVTVNGTEILAFDLGSHGVSAQWGKEVKTDRKYISPDFRPINQAFDLIRKCHRSKKTNVSYTGEKKGIRYVFQRGRGKGLTKGVRTTLFDVSRAEYDKLRNLILNFIGKPIPVTVFDYTLQTMVKSESTPHFYIIGYNPSTKELNFLHATVENEICVPQKWQTLNHIP